MEGVEMSKKSFESKTKPLAKYIKKTISFEPVSFNYFNKKSHGYKSCSSNTDNDMFSPVNITPVSFNQPNSLKASEDNFTFSFFNLPTASTKQEYKILRGSVRYVKDIFLAIENKITINMQQDSQLILADGSYDTFIENLELVLGCKVIFNDWSFRFVPKFATYKITISLKNLKEILNKEIDVINRYIYKKVIDNWLYNEDKYIEAWFTDNLMEVVVNYRSNFENILYQLNCHEDGNLLTLIENPEEAVIMGDS